jgi:hypothetical protein
MFFVSAIRTSSRGWPRSSSTHEPSDPPLRMESHGFFYLYIPVKVLYIVLNFLLCFMDFGRSPEYFLVLRTNLKRALGLTSHTFEARSANTSSAGRSNARYMYLAIPGILTSDSLNLSIPSDDDQSAAIEGTRIFETPTDLSLQPDEELYC